MIEAGAWARLHSHAALASHRVSAETQAALAHVLVNQVGADSSLIEDKNSKVVLEYIEPNQTGSHPLFGDPQYTFTLLPKLRPAAPLDANRIRAGFPKRTGQPKSA